MSRICFATLMALLLACSSSGDTQSAPTAQPTPHECALVVIDDTSDVLLVVAPRGYGFYTCYYFFF